MSDLGKKINELRLKRGMTLEQLGDKAGVSKATVMRWENGDIANMKRDKIQKVADALQVSPGYLMGWEEEINPTTIMQSYLPTDEKGQIMLEIHKTTETMSENHLKVLLEYARLLNQLKDKNKNND